VKARVKWLEGMAYVGESGSGHAIVMDGPPELGGRNLGVRPMEMLLLGLGSCSAVDVRYAGASRRWYQATLADSRGDESGIQGDDKNDLLDLVTQI